MGFYCLKRWHYFNRKRKVFVEAWWCKVLCNVWSNDFYDMTLATEWQWHHMGRVKRIWYLSPMRAAKVQASLRIRAVSPEPSLLAHTSSKSRGTFRLKPRSPARLNGWACAVTICHDGMLEDTNSLDGAHMINVTWRSNMSVIRRVKYHLLGLGVMTVWHLW